MGEYRHDAQTPVKAVDIDSGGANTGVGVKRHRHGYDCSRREHRVKKKE